MTTKLADAKLDIMKLGLNVKDVLILVRLVIMLIAVQLVEPLQTELIQLLVLV